MNTRTEPTPAATAPEPLAANLCWLLSQAGHALTTELTAGLEGLGISPRGYCVLTSAMTGDHTQTELARMVGIDKTTMVVLSSPIACASSVWVNSPVMAVASRHWPRGEMPTASSAAVSSSLSAWLACASSQPRFATGGAGGRRSGALTAIGADATKIDPPTNNLGRDYFGPATVSAPSLCAHPMRKG